MDPFRRGFLLVPDTACVPPSVARWTTGWRSKTIANRLLLIHPLVPVAEARSGPARVCCLGLICDVFAPHLTDGDVLQGLAASLALGWQPFYARLKTTGGTYLLFLEYDGLHIILDAVGLVPACHGRLDGETIVASHPKLVADVIGSEISALVRDLTSNPQFEAGGEYLPGLLTSYVGVEIVTPNQRFDVRTREMHRFFPDADWSETPLDAIVDQLVPALTGQIDRMAGLSRLAFSLSGGMDSRLTLACSKSVSHQSLYFTYYTDDKVILKEDSSIAGEIAGRFGLTHLVFKTDEGAVPSDFLEAWQLCSDGIHGKASTTWHLHKDVGDRFVHVRSNIVEIAKGFYLRNKANRKESFDPRTLARLYKPRMQDMFTTTFDDFIQRCFFQSNRFRGYHFSDLFYWEHRLAAWLGPIIRSTRQAFETYIIYNSRVLLELMMARPLEERLKAKVVLAMMERAWPDLIDMRMLSGSKFWNLRAGSALDANNEGRT